MLSARQLGIARLIKSSELMSQQTTVDSLLLSVAGDQPSDSNHSIAIVCSNESTFFFSKADDCILHA